MMSKTNENYVKKIVEEGKRIDNRKFDEMRKINIETGLITSAEGSAKVIIGTTVAIAGVKMEVKEPYPDTPDEGMLMVDMELMPLASPEFEPGPPNSTAIEIARVVDRGIRESHAIDMQKLCIEPGELAWSINIDIHVLNDGGNLLDACGLAAMAALMNTKIPIYNKEEGKISHDKPGTEKLPLVDIPIPITITKISDKLLLDTNHEEEQAVDAKITITSTKDGNLCAIQKEGTGYLTIDEIETAANLSIQKGKEIRALL